MGAWGSGIEECDTVLDILGTFDAALRATQDVAAASDKVREEYDYYFVANDANPDDRAHARIGLALAQWRYGALDAGLFNEVRADFAARHGIDSYSEAAARAKAVRVFVAKLDKPNPRPRGMPKPATKPRKPRLAAFNAGECLALQLPSGEFRAALVLVRDHASDGDEFNVIARLDWQGSHAPPRELFVAPRVQNIAMYPCGPYKGPAQVSVVDFIEVEATLFGIEKMPGYWPWQFVRAGKPGRPLAWISWEEIAGLLL